MPESIARQKKQELSFSLDACMMKRELEPVSILELGFQMQLKERNALRLIITTASKR